MSRFSLLQPCVNSIEKKSYCNNGYLSLQNAALYRSVADDDVYEISVVSWVPRPTYRKVNGHLFVIMAREHAMIEQTPLLP